MQAKLIKPWGPYAAGTVVADNKAEADATAGAIWVGFERFADLYARGLFEEKKPERPIPTEVRTGDKEVSFPLGSASPVEPLKAKLPARPAPAVEPPAETPPPPPITFADEES